MQSIDVVTSFLTGLFAGGISCMVLQGGLFTAAVSGSALRENTREKVRPVIIFLVAKVIAYTALGYFLGWIGSFFTISISLQIFLQILVILFMVLTILGMVTDYPLFSYFSLRTPNKIISKLSPYWQKKHTWLYALLGGLTVLLPCGVTQAMMALAVGTGSPLRGAMVLFAYSLGTTPVFFLLGAMIVRLTSTLKTKFSYVAALGVFVLVVANVNNTLSLAVNGLTLQKIAGNIYCIFSLCSSATQLPPQDNETITIANEGYTPNSFAVRAGSRVTLHLVNENATNCTQSFTIPKIGLQETVPLGTERTLSFTAPPKPGLLSYMCSQGNYVGQIQVM